MLKNINHKEKLLEIYWKSLIILDIDNLSDEITNFLKIITDNIERNKAVYTVLITLMVHKILEPKQDIRYFQSKMENGFSAPNYWC